MLISFFILAFDLQIRQLYLDKKKKWLAAITKSLAQ